MTAELRFWSKIKVGTPDICWPWMAARTAKGYGVVNFGGRAKTAHGVAFRLIHGDVAAGCICHACDNPPCCNPWHLWAGSHSDNSRDMVLKGRAPFGRRTLTDEQALQVRRDPRSGKALAVEYGVSESTISRIRNGLSGQPIEDKRACSPVGAPGRFRSPPESAHLSHEECAG